jgi:hypothetical protein
MFDLTPLDIHQLDFRDTILIDQTYYRLNKVLNYNPFKAGLTKVELFKAGDISFAGSESVAEGSGKPIGLGKLEEKAPTSQGKTLTNGNQFEPFQGKVIGSNNVVSPNAAGFFIQGDGNRVGASKNVTLIGSNCTVANGVQNVTAIGVNGLTITESDKVINGVGGIQTAKLFIPSAEVLTLNSVPKAFGLSVPAGYYAKPMGADLFVDFNSISYATNLQVSISAAGGSHFMLRSINDPLGSTVSTFSQLSLAQDSFDLTQIVGGADLEVFVPAGDPTAGDSDITIYLTYVLIEL